MKDKKLTPIAGLLLILAIAITTNTIINRPSPTYRIAIETQRLQTAAKIQHLKIALSYSLAAILLAGLAAGLGLTAWTAWRRSQLIQPHPTGLFPIIRERTGRQTYYHDPNRQLTGTTTYTPGPAGIQMQQILTPGAETEQLQIATQAQAVQIAVAATRTAQNNPTPNAAQRLIDHITQTHPIPPLPTITTLDETIPEEHQLLTAIQTTAPDP